MKKNRSKKRKIKKTEEDGDEVEKTHDVYENGFRNKLCSLKSKTLFLSVLVFSIFGILVGYYVSGGIFKEKFLTVNFKKSGSSSISLSFKTPFPAKTKVMYGTSGVFINEKDISTDYTTDHIIYIRGVLIDIPHKFKLIAIDEDGKQYVSKIYEVD